CANTLIRYLSGALAEPPKLECSKCRFGLWLKRALITPDPLLEEVAELHRDYQYLGKHLIAAKAEGELDNTRDYTRQIESVRDRLVRLLERRIGMGSEA
ncbi:hypothetical protein RZS08_29345, partial [Arthrospira platensis SPKY1]|nr:hypothetical protein [Arthrospira platensis SPKY1]